MLSTAQSTKDTETDNGKFPSKFSRGIEGRGCYNKCHDNGIGYPIRIERRAPDPAWKNSVKFPRKKSLIIIATSNCIRSYLRVKTEVLKLAPKSTTWSVLLPPSSLILTRTGFASDTLVSLPFAKLTRCIPTLGFCPCCFLCLECSFPRCSYCSPHLLQVFGQIALSQ